MSIVLKGVGMPDNCFRCFAAQWEADAVGYSCRVMHVLAVRNRIIPNNEARAKRRDDCPLILLEEIRVAPYLIPKEEING